MSAMRAPETKPVVLVVGASGPLGRAVVDALLARGARVRAFARHASTIPPREALERVDGSALDSSAIASVMVGVGSVVCVLGPTKTSEPDVCGRGTERLVRAMREHHVSRLVCVTGAMIGHPRERLGRVYRFIASRVPAPAMEDRRAQETVVRESGLEWTLVRPTRLTNGPRTGRILAGDDFRIGALAHVSRADVAAFVADVLARPDTIGRAYALTTGAHAVDERRP
jgi:uncharacterized protein YbjT (DUF2867 family)